MNFLGLEIGGTKLQVVAGTAGRIVDRRRFMVDKEAGSEGIRRQIASVLPELMQQHSPLAVGVGFGGPVDWKTGSICCSHQISGWSEFPLGEWLANQTRLPVKVENDAHVAAWAESQLGADARANPLLFMTLGSGIGGGLVADGAIYHGALPGQAEIGHLQLERGGATLESLCCGWAIDRKIREARASRPESVLFKLIGNETRGEARHLSAALAMNDAFAREIIDEAGSTLAYGISHAAHLFHPEVVVLGGGLALIGEPLRRAVADALPQFMMKAFQPGPRIAISSLQEDAIPIGALLLAEQIAST